MRIILCILVASSSIFTLYGQRTEFYREDIAFQLSEKYFIVNGDYYFRNSLNSEVKRLLFYPFDTINNEELIDSVIVHNITGNTIEKILEQTHHGFTFEARIAAHDTSIYRIVYRQRIVSDSVLYILRTTKSWNKPLERAEYTLMVENPGSIRTLSYPPDSVYQIGGMKIYRWRRENFLPEKDLVIHYIVNANK